MTGLVVITNNYFDVVAAYGFLHHLERLNKTFSEAFRVLKKGGILGHNIGDTLLPIGGTLIYPPVSGIL